MAFAFIAFSLLASAVASAETLVDVNVISDSVCPCSTMTLNDFEITVENTGDAEETYALELLLPDDDWSGFIVPEVTVPAGGEKPASAFITPSCSVVPGTYVIGVSAVEKSTGTETIENFNIEIGKCRWVEITAGEYEACQEKATAFELRFFNAGENDEKISIASDTEWITFSETTFDISAGETEAVDVLATPPSDIEGTVDIEVSLESEISYAKNKAVFTVDVRKCYGTEFTVDPLRADLCPCETAKFTLNIRNSGLMEDQYTVRYGDQEDRIILESHAEGIVTLLIDVPCDKEAGDYHVPIEIDSNDPLVSSLTVGVYDSGYCYATTFDSEETEISLDVGQSYTFAVSLANKGRFNQLLELSLEGPEWAHLSDSAVPIKSGDTETLYLYVAPEYETAAGEYPVTLSTSAGTVESSIEFLITVNTDFVTGEGINASGEPEMEADIGIPTGEVTGMDVAADKPWSQIMMISVLAIGVVFILILRFVVMMK